MCSFPLKCPDLPNLQILESISGVKKKSRPTEAEMSDTPKSFQGFPDACPCEPVRDEGQRTPSLQKYNHTESERTQPRSNPAPLTPEPVAMTTVGFCGNSGRY